MNGKTGHRSITPNSLRGELLARSFIGLPDGTSPQNALKIIRRHINGTSDLSRRAKLMMLALLQIQAVSILAAPEEDSSHLERDAFTVFARNETLQALLAMSRRTVQKAISELREALFIWCNDAPDRNRSKFHGISLLPAFARISEFSTAEFERVANQVTVREVQRQFASLKIELEALKQMAGSDFCRGIDALVRRCDVLRRSREFQTGLDHLPAIKAAVDELKSAIVNRLPESKDESPQRDLPDAPLTEDSRNLSKDVDGAENLEASLISRSVERSSHPVSLVGPSPERIIQAVEAIFKAKGIPTYSQTPWAEAFLLRQYGRASAAFIRLRRDVVDDLEAKFGATGASHIFIQAACDPTIRNRIAWARSFLRECPSKTRIDTRRSFDRWGSDAFRLC